MKPITVRGRPLGEGGRPALCAPLVSRTAGGLLVELSTVLRAQPDIVEWRADFFEGIGEAGKVVDAARALKAALGGLPLLFTCRSAAEGGQPVSAPRERIIATYAEVCAAGAADLVDCELSSEGVEAIRESSRRHGVGLVLSFHDFQGTPPRETIVARLREAEARGADIAKVAVMPKSKDDVLLLLGASQEAAGTLGIPLITMSMGPLGAITRVAGYQFGSALTFGVGAAASAPGQVALADLRTAIEALRRTQ